MLKDDDLQRELAPPVDLIWNLLVDCLGLNEMLVIVAGEEHE